MDFVNLTILKNVYECSPEAARQCIGWCVQQQLKMNYGISAFVIVAYIGIIILMILRRFPQSGEISRFRKYLNDDTLLRAAFYFLTVYLILLLYLYSGQDVYSFPVIS